MTQEELNKINALLRQRQELIERLYSLAEMAKPKSDANPPQVEPPPPPVPAAEFTVTWSYLLIAVAGLLAGMGFVVLLTAALWLGFTRLWR